MTEKFLKALSTLKPVSKDELEKIMLERRDVNPFVQGYRCYTRNKDIQSCPYDRDTDEFDSWMNGFFAAEVDEAFQTWREEYGGRE